MGGAAAQGWVGGGGRHRRGAVSRGWRAVGMRERRRDEAAASQEGPIKMKRVTHKNISYLQPH